MRETLGRALGDAADLLAALRQDAQAIAAMETLAQRIVGAFRDGKKVLACGNGGSMADAMHFAEEFSGRFREDRPAYPVMALCDATHLTCVSNDYGFDYVFSRLVQALGQPGDVLVLISTSGRSMNMIRAAEMGRERGCYTVGVLGKGGGEMRALCDLVLHVPGETSDRIQELHMLCLHAVIEACEVELGHL